MEISWFAPSFTAAEYLMTFTTVKVVDVVLCLGTYYISAQLRHGTVYKYNLSTTLKLLKNCFKLPYFSITVV